MFNQNFDIQSYLEDSLIDYSTRGKNVSNGWIGIQCPFCHDRSNHLGIELATKRFKCWICGINGNNIEFLVSKISKCSKNKALRIIAKFSSESIFSKNAYDDIRFNEIVDPRQQNERILPIESTNLFPKMHIEYLKSRNFESNAIIQKYKLKACNNIGDWKFRIIAPIFINKQLVSFISRDVTGKSDIPYLPLQNSKSVIPYKHTLYNFDNITKRNVLIVEGVTDVWRFGDNTIATMSYNFTKEQIELLLTKNIQNAFVMFDCESKAIKKAHELAIELNLLGLNTEVIELSNGDPADMLQSKADLLKTELEL